MSRRPKSPPEAEADPFFVGWAPAAPVHRRTLLVSAGATLLAGAGVSAAIASQQAPVGPGGWDTQVRSWTGWLQRTPYPSLLIREDDGALRTAWLAGMGKQSVAPIIPEGLSGAVTVQGSLIARGPHRMIAGTGAPDWIAASPDAPPTPDPGYEEEIGAALIFGEVLDAKCWFGAMKPATGKTHKACAALCARGGLPLAFCDERSCGDALAAPLFLDADGRAHTADILPFVADPVAARGTLVRVRDTVQFRVAVSSLRRV
ncbi:hypothetical protein GC169_04145 [bacterium]|nr:hypothetical protein [bacterium]